MMKPRPLFFSSSASFSLLPSLPPSDYYYLLFIIPFIYDLYLLMELIVIVINQLAMLKLIEKVEN